ncbi:MAG TPA: hypothetical protein P5079_06790 [Elusimicrobiota bacterium]|nr:hypothetical protein [Elusimicrobiota bacterium]
MGKKLWSVFLATVMAAVFSAAFVRAEEGEIFVTDVLVVDNNASVTLNDAIQIRDVKVNKSGDRITLKFPEYVGKSGRAFPQVTVQSKKAYDNIVEAISSGQPSKDKAKTIKFRVEDPQILRSPSRRANVEVTFNDAISMTLGVLKSKREGQPYWIGYPGRRNAETGKYVNQVVIINPKLKKAVEQAILDKFERALSEQGESGGEEGGADSER